MLLLPLLALHELPLLLTPGCCYCCWSSSFRCLRSRAPPRWDSFSVRPSHHAEDVACLAPPSNTLGNGTNARIILLSEYCAVQRALRSVWLVQSCEGACSTPYSLCSAAMVISAHDDQICVWALQAQRGCELWQATKARASTVVLHGTRGSRCGCTCADFSQSQRSPSTYSPGVCARGGKQHAGQCQRKRVSTGQAR